MPLTAATLEAFVGRSIADICPNHYETTAENHCAHFVSHALKLQIRTLCGDMAYATRHTGATVRCNELYNGLARRGAWADRPTLDDGLIIFVLSARQVVDNLMQPVPQKHVGIHFGGKVYNYSNGQHKVVADPTVAMFHAKFKQIYAGGDVSLFYGVAP